MTNDSIMTSALEEDKMETVNGEIAVLIKAETNEVLQLGYTLPKDITKRRALQSQLIGGIPKEIKFTEKHNIVVNNTGNMQWPLFINNLGTYFLHNIIGLENVPTGKDFQFGFGPMKPAVNYILGDVILVGYTREDVLSLLNN